MNNKYILIHLKNGIGQFRLLFHAFIDCEGKKMRMSQYEMCFQNLSLHFTNIIIENILTNDLQTYSIITLVQTISWLLFSSAYWHAWCEEQFWFAIYRSLSKETLPVTSYSGLVRFPWEYVPWCKSECSLKSIEWNKSIWKKIYQNIHFHITLKDISTLLKYIRSILKSKQETLYFNT